jgi:hypothetical protein
MVARPLYSIAELLYVTSKFMVVVSTDSFLLFVEFFISNSSPFPVGTNCLIENYTMAMELWVFVAVIIVVKDGYLGCFTG